MAATLRPRGLRTVAILGASALAAALSAGTASAGTAAAGTGPGVLRVGCGNGAYSTIGAAVTAASPGDTVLVCRGTYHELVTVPAGKPLTIEGAGHPVIDAAGLGDPATGQYSAVLVLASHSVISGLTVEGAFGEGILVQGSPGSPVTAVTIRDNTVTGNDQGNRTFSLLTGSPYAQCNEVPGSPPLPGDCGEGIHLWTATDSAVVGNVITNNNGGVLLTDEYGPTHGNLIAFNTVSDNETDCGVTLGGHNPAAAPGGVPDPAAGGVYGNLIEHNSVTDSGRHGQGSGVLMGTALPGGAVYDNTVVGNYLSGNGLSGVTVHSHAPDQDLNGNVVTRNVIATNNLNGDDNFAPGDPSPTGVLVGTVTPLAITIRGNIIRDDTYGIWTTPQVTVAGAADNLFQAVTTPVYVAP